MDKKYELEFFEENTNERNKLQITKKYSSDDLEFSISTGVREVSIKITEKEALEIASQIFRNVLGLY